MIRFAALLVSFKGSLSCERWSCSLMIVSHLVQDKALGQSRASHIRDFCTIVP
jgi:hypothetical protein